MDGLAPSYEDMMPALLSVQQNGSRLFLHQVYLAVTPEQLAHTIPSGSQTTIRSRVGWAKTNLVKMALTPVLEQPRRHQG